MDFSFTPKCKGSICKLHNCGKCPFIYANAGQTKCARKETPSIIYTKHEDPIVTATRNFLLKHLN